MSNLVGNPEDRFSHNEARIISLVSKSQILYKHLASNCSCTDWFMSDLVENRKDRFSQIETHLVLPHCVYSYHDHNVCSYFTSTVNSYSHVRMVSYPNPTFPGQPSSKQLTSTQCLSFTSN